VINTNPATLRSGTVWFEISLTNNGNVDLMEMGDISYEFDLKSAESAIGSVGVIPGGVSIKTTDYTSTGKSLYQILTGELANFLIASIPTADAKMYWLKHGETVPKTFPFQLQFSGVDTDITKNITSMSFIPPVQDNTNVRVFFPDVDATQRVFRVGATNYQAYPMGDVIIDYISRLDDSAGTSYVYGSGDDSIGGFGGYPNTIMLNPSTLEGTVVYAFTNTNSINSIRQNDPIRNKIVSAAALEGAVFGSAFSVNFYMNRLRTNVNIELTNSDLESIKYVQLDRQVNTVNVFLNTQVYTSGFQALPGNTTPPTAKVSGEIAGYPLGTQFVGLDLQAHAPQFNRGLWEFFGVTTTRVINADSVGLDTVTGAIAQLGAKAYSQAFSCYQVSGVPNKVDMTVLGVDKVHPYHAIKFTGDAPEVFKNKHFRPSSIKYNFKDDKTQITAYEIIP
jgi:hypothetical protein